VIAAPQQRLKTGAEHRKQQQRHLRAEFFALAVVASATPNRPIAISATLPSSFATILAPSSSYSLNSSNSSDSMPGLNAPTAYDYVQALYRLLAVQSGSSSTAESAMKEIFIQAFEEADKQLERLDFDGLFRTAFRSRDSYPRKAEPELNGWARKLHQLPEPERFSITLFCLEILPPATIAEITETTLDTLADRVAKARRELNFNLS
jgi:hypothetical protein